MKKVFLIKPHTAGQHRLYVESFCDAFGDITQYMKIAKWLPWTKRSIKITVEYLKPKEGKK